jgi:tetratricopeptide (TPR) repeat protein
MTRKLPLFFFLVFFIKPCFSQDTLVYYHELVFSSPFEKRVLDDHFLNKKTDLFNLFMANGTTQNESKFQEARTRFYNTLDKISNTPDAKNKKNDKRLKYLYDNIHQTFLTKYELKNKFEDIFDNGLYNCVSASALYALSFDKLNVPFIIKEKPTHVYLMAYPQNEEIIIETTSPTSAYGSINENFKTAYVKMLKDQKIISNAEFTAGNADELFDKHYFSEQENISESNLVGIQYMNDGLYKFENKQYVKAFEQLQKAYLFYPSTRIGYLLYMSLTFVIEDTQSEPIKQVDYLGKYMRFKDYVSSTGVIQNEFNHITYKLLVESSDPAKLDVCFHKLDSATNDVKLKNEMSFIYNYENGRYFYNQGQYKKSLQYLEKALALKPNNSDVNNLFTAALSQILRDDNINAGTISQLEHYPTQYPSLATNNLYNNLVAHVYLYECSTSFDQNKPVEGDKYKTMFENHLAKFPELAIEGRLVGNAYSRAAVFYFRKGQTSKAKAIIAKGLTYAPNSDELQARQRMIK